MPLIIKNKKSKHSQPVSESDWAYMQSKGMAKRFYIVSSTQVTNKVVEIPSDVLNFKNKGKEKAQTEAPPAKEGDVSK